VGPWVSDLSCLFSPPTHIHIHPLWCQSGLDMNVDWVTKCVDIVAYQLLWSTTDEGSNWFVTGIKDLVLTNNSNNPTRMYSMFLNYKYFNDIFTV
jgi:hypothetical protein